MCPVNFNPLINLGEIANKDRITKNVYGVEKINKTTTPEDTFTKSEFLNSVESALVDNTMSAAQLQKIAELKQKISNNELAILSNDPDVRMSAARNVAQKLLAFEQQLQIDTSKE